MQQATRKQGIQAEIIAYFFNSAIIASYLLFMQYL